MHLPTHLMIITDTAPFISCIFTLRRGQRREWFEFTASLDVAEIETSGSFG
jgi:hypothetical protein